MQQRVAVAALCLTSLVAGCSKPVPVGEIHAASTSNSTDVPLAAPAAGDWPAWRGPRGSGAEPDAEPPTLWDSSLNVVWKSAVPGRGHSSPIVRGDNVFMATADESQQTQSLLCFDRAKGSLRWNTTVHVGPFDHAHQKNTHASATPACDGERVYITFLNKRAIWLSALDLSGKIAWQREVGPFETMHGYAASPALFQSLAIVAGDSRRGGFLAGVHRVTGEIVWRVARPPKTSFSSPIVAHVAGRDQVLSCGCGAVDSYDPLTGERLWYYTGGPTETTSGTVAFDDQHVYASGGYPGQQTVCLRADGTGDVTQSHVVWQNSQKFYVPSLLVHDGLVFAVNDSGVAYCYQASDGKQLWTRRLGGGFSSSPTLLGKHIYACNEAGKVYVFKPAREFQRVAENDLGDGGFASPAASGKHLFLRTERHLFCLGEN